MSDTEMTQLQKDIADVEKQFKAGKIERDVADRRIELLKLEAKLHDENAAKTGLGLRRLAGMTRGKGSQVIQYDAFDESVPDSLPKSVEQFVSVTGIKSNADLASLLVTGFNAKQYTEASDPIAEHVNPAWDDETKIKFRAVVRGLVTINGETVESAVAMVKPGTEKKFLASQGVAR